jgi:hypothetical protein
MFEWKLNYFQLARSSSSRLEAFADGSLQKKKMSLEM